uniref:Uncharacterized protein n=1 Tax=viral metagenome TaxID=1070528 RepID=A0A6C0EEX9_9ZZZZ
MDKARFNFAKSNPDMCYNPDPQKSSYYQICGIKNKLTNDYTVRKFIINEKQDIIKVFTKEYSKAKLKKFIKNAPRHKYRIYPTNDLNVIEYPDAGTLLNSQSSLL